MDVRVDEDWNKVGNHDSKYGEGEIKTLVLQVANLPNITQLSALPPGVKIFSQNCILGNTPIWVTKGIHERWDKIRADGVKTKDADPHVQFKFNFVYSSGSRWVTGHLFLSETYAFTESYSDGDWDRYGWKVVGVGITWDGTPQRFPGHFVQSVSNIQEQGSGRRGLKRRNSVGLIVAPQFQPVEAVGGT